MLKPDLNDIHRASRIFKALSHPDRLRLACRLTDAGPSTQKALIQEFQWPQSTMARHLALLRQNGLIVAKRDGSGLQLRVAGPLVERFLDAMCHWVHPETGETLSHGINGETSDPAGNAPDNRPVATTSEEEER